MLMELAAAAMVGLMFANVWVCAMAGFAAGSEGTRVGLGFIAGRVVGLLLLGSAIALLRPTLEEAGPWMLWAFGISSLAFGIFIFYRSFRTTRAPAKDGAAHGCGGAGNCPVRDLDSPKGFARVVRWFRRGGSKKMEARNKTRGGPDGFGGRWTRGGPDDAHDCGSCSHGGCEGSGGGCPGAHGDGGGHGGGDRHGGGDCHGVHDDRGSRWDIGSGVALGVLRGATPCYKMFILAPLLITVGMPMAIPIILVYAAVSSVYPLIGMLSASVVTGMSRGLPYMRVVGAVCMVAIGAYSLYNAAVWNMVEHGGGGLG